MQGRYNARSKTFSVRSAPPLARAQGPKADQLGDESAERVQRREFIRTLLHTKTITSVKEVDGQIVLKLANLTELRIPNGKLFYKTKKGAQGSL